MAFDPKCTYSYMNKPFRMPSKPNATSGLERARYRGVLLKYVTIYTSPLNKCFLVITHLFFPKLKQPNQVKLYSHTSVAFCSNMFFRKMTKVSHTSQASDGAATLSENIKWVTIVWNYSHHSFSHVWLARNWFREIENTDSWQVR